MKKIVIQWLEEKMRWHTKIRKKRAKKKGNKKTKKNKTLKIHQSFEDDFFQ